MTYVRRLLSFLVVSGVSIGLDQWTKAIATAELRGRPARIWFNDLFRLQWATNEGAFLSLGASLSPEMRYWLLTLAVGGLLLSLTVYTLVSKKLDSFQVASYALIVSGGFSNWVDRARFNGVVVDFMNMGIGPVRTGVFNVADLAILAGIALLFLHARKQEQAQKAAAASPGAASSDAPKSP